MSIDVSGGGTGVGVSDVLNGQVIDGETETGGESESAAGDDGKRSAAESPRTDR